ncbi:MAG: heavy metal-responsive transcriptional regulator [Actinomycetia bacterium]|nr:heavy metal-responsive transcriptional regulator [Actinomycetes bacterium]
MTQSDDAPRYRIGELAARTGIPARTIRFYEAKGVLPPPPRSTSGYRWYGPADVKRLELLRRAKALGLTLEAIGSVIALREGGHAPCAHVRQLLDDRLAEIRKQLDALRALEAELQALRTWADTVEGPGDDDGYCPILEASRQGVRPEV